MKPVHLRMGARGSTLSLAQSRAVAAQLEARHPGLTVELVPITSTGDKIADRPLHEFGGKGLFTKELEQALLAGEVDFAVHSFKDVPVTMPLVDTTELVIASVPARASAWDVLVSTSAVHLNGVAHGARIGTGSLRRQAQLKAARPDLVTLGIRGNIDTRLRKLHAGQFDGIILAMAGLQRAGLWDEQTMTALPLDVMVPSAGQGALAIECRRDDARTRELVRALHDDVTAACVELERAVVLRLNGDCHSPIAAYAVRAGDRVTLTAAVGRRDGMPPVVRAQAEGAAGESQRVVDAVLAELEKLGARKLLLGEEAE